MMTLLTEQDLSGIMACYHSANELFPAEQRPNAVADDFLAILEKDTAYGYFDNGHLVGFISFFEKDNVLILSSLYVERGCGRKGIGTLLLDLAIRQAQVSGIKECAASCLKNADWALRFYQKHGFVLEPNEQEPWAFYARKPIA